MGIFDKLFGMFRPGGPPRINDTGAQTSPVLPLPQDSVYHLPNPSPMLRGNWQPSPDRVHSPAMTRKHWYTKFDQGNPAVERVPDLPLQQYFNQAKELEPVRVFAPAHGVKVPKYSYNKGYMQMHIPTEVRRDPVVFSSPPVLLSRPLRSQTVQGQKARKPIRASAPKRNRGGSQ